MPSSLPRKTPRNPVHRVMTFPFGSFQPPALTHAVAEAVRDQVTPGVAVAVGRAGTTSSFNFGRLYAPGTAGSPTTQVDENTIYDLASLTKALCTSVLAMVAVARGTLDLRNDIRRWLPHAPAGITPEHLLAHSSGWPAHRKFYSELWPGGTGPAPALLRDQLMSLLQDTPLQAAPGARTVYSDLGFIALGHILECVFNQPLDLAFARNVAAPLELATLRFGVRARDQDATAPTEQCAWRSKLMLGQVHDQNAWAMGGVAGHAGLFGTATEVALLGQSLLRSHADSPAKGDPVKRDVLRYFWQYRRNTAATWALGWDRPSQVGSLAGATIDRRAVGHLGFTGCSVWLDPYAQTVVAMLSNRVHPTVADDPRFRQLRPTVMDAALQDVGYARLP